MGGRQGEVKTHMRVSLCTSILYSKTLHVMILSDLRLPLH
jgi:hypothetical protein